MARYLSNIYVEVRNRPIYRIESLLNFSNDKNKDGTNVFRDYKESA